MSATTTPATEGRFFSAYSDLEPKIRDLTHMAELARSHAIDTFGSNSPDEAEERKRERGIALFAVIHVEEMVRLRSTSLGRAGDPRWRLRSGPAGVVGFLQVSNHFLEVDNRE